MLAPLSAIPGPDGKRIDLQIAVEHLQALRRNVVGLDCAA